MKKAAEIKRKLKQVLYRHRKKYVEEGLRRRPANCTHNAVIEIGDPSRSNRTHLRICTWGIEDAKEPGAFRQEDGGEWNAVTCDESLGGRKQCRDCPTFECGSEAEDLKAAFATMLGVDGTEVDIGWIAKQYPDVAALMWVLDSEPHSEKPPPKPDPDVNILSFFGGDLDNTVAPEEPLTGD